MAVNKTCALGNSPVFLGSPRDVDCFGLACTVVNTNAREVEPLSIHAYKQGGAQLVVGAALAEGTAGVELIVGAEKVATENPEALGPGPYGEAGHEAEMPPREGEQGPNALMQKGEHEVNAPAQGSPNEGKHGGGHEALRQSEREVPPRRDPNEGGLATWDPRGKLLRKQFSRQKGPVEVSVGGQR